VVHAASIQDRDGAKLVLAKLVGKFPRLQKIWADGGYAGQLIAWVKELGGWILEIVKRPDDVAGFHALPKRWVIEVTQSQCPFEQETVSIRSLRDTSSQCRPSVTLPLLSAITTTACLGCSR